MASSSPSKTRPFSKSGSSKATKTLRFNCSLINLGIIQCSVAMVNFTFSFRTIILRIVANLMTLTLEHDPRFRRVPINNFQMLCHDHRCDKQENIFKEKIIGM